MLIGPAGVGVTDTRALAVGAGGDLSTGALVDVTEMIGVAETIEAGATLGSLVGTLDGTGAAAGIEVDVAVTIDLGVLVD